MTTADASDVAEQPPHRGKVMSWLSKVFELNPQGLNWARGVMFLDVVLVPLVVLVAIGEQQYLLSAVFAVLFAGVADPGGSYGYRASRIAVFGLAGAAVTALGFGIATSGWGWLVLAVFAVTLVSGLTVKFGLHRFVAADAPQHLVRHRPRSRVQTSTTPTSPATPGLRRSRGPGGRRCGSPSRSLSG